MSTNPPPPSIAAKRLAGKVAIITGGASGIGAATVQIFHENGAKVVIADVQDDLGQTLAEKLGKDVSYIHCDISNEQDIINLVDTTIATHGQLDIMYNNAGIQDRPHGSILDTSMSDLEHLIKVNLVGSVLGAKHAARVMVPNKKGCILFTAGACTGTGGIASHPYAVTKWGIVGLVKNLAAELGKFGVRVNCVSPFGVVTPMVGQFTEDQVPAMEGYISQLGNLKGQVLKAESVAMAALYLASDEANYVSGLNLFVDGGYSIVNPTIMNRSTM